MFKAGVVMLILSNLAIWYAAIWVSEKNLRVVFCDVGQGDAAIVIKGNVQVLIDGGPGNRVMGCLTKHMPFYDKKIEVVVMTHPQADHGEGLNYVLERYNLDYFVTVPVENKSLGYRKLVEIVERKKIKVVNLYAGDQISFGEVRFKVVWPTKEFVGSHLDKQEDGFLSNVLGLLTDGTDLNGYGIVMNLEFGEFSTMFTADVDSGFQKEMLLTGLVENVDVLKVPHHGSKTGMIEEWLLEVDPELSVISVGRGNTYGHPGINILKMLGEIDSKVFRTDVDREVVVVSNGKSWWKQERGIMIR